MPPAELPDDEYPLMLTIVRVSYPSRREEIAAKAKLTGRVDAGPVFATFHFPESATSFLTNPVVDPLAQIPEFKVCAVKLSKQGEPSPG